MKRLINAIITVIICLASLYVILNKNKQIKSVESKLQVIEKERDSLQYEITSKDIEMSRYEIIFERAQGEMSPDCKQELEKILHETE
jgi:cell division protein FtsL